jgi:hypothetical protein
VKEAKSSGGTICGLALAAIFEKKRKEDSLIAKEDMERTFNDSGRKWGGSVITGALPWRPRHESLTNEGPDLPDQRRLRGRHVWEESNSSVAKSKWLNGRWYKMIRSTYSQGASRMCQESCLAKKRLHLGAESMRGRSVHTRGGSWKAGGNWQ